MVVKRFSENPLISPKDAKPSIQGWEVVGTYNCGAFKWKEKIGLLVRVTERPIADNPNSVCAPVLEFSKGQKKMVVKVWKRTEVDLSDPRFVKADLTYDAIHSHLRLAWSDDGKQFVLSNTPTLSGEESWEAFGIHDPRVLYISGQWTIIYSGGGHWGPVMCLAITRDWINFERKGVIFVPDNKDVALFPEKLNGKYCCLHRPSGVYYGGNNMWIGYSTDLLHWGEFKPVAKCRPKMWDSHRIGCGPEPIKTEEGWLEFYHGSDGKNYYVGAILLDIKDPSKVIARSAKPLLSPKETYEKYGFYDNIVFPCGFVRRSDDLIWLYYGAADRYVAGCEVSLSSVLDTLQS